MLVLADKRALPAASVLWSKTIRVFVQMLTAESRGRAGQSRAGQSRAGQGRAGQGRAGQGRAGQGRAGQGRARDWQGREGPSHFLWTGKGRKASRGQGVTCKSRWSLAAWQRTQQKSHSSTRSCAGGCPSHVSSGPCSALPPWAADTAQHLQSTYTQSCTHKSCISAVLHHIIIIIIIIIIIMIIIKTLSSS
jgi:hypothetical protein